jgi:hypothetical protein
MRQRSAGPDGRAGQVIVDGAGAAATGLGLEPPAVGARIDWWLWPTAAAWPTAVLALVLAADLGSPWRPIAALLFLTVAPGASLVPLIGIPDVAMELMLVIPLSFALVALTSAALFYPRLWSPDRELVVMFGLCLVGLTLQCIGSRRSTSRAGVTQ